MKCFDLTLRGFSGETDKNDHLVKWVLAPNLTSVELFCVGVNLPKDDVQSIDEKPGCGHYDFMDGIDVKIDENGTILATAPGCDPTLWNEQAGTIDP